MMGERRVEADGTAADFERRVMNALGKVRPALQADGGDIELLGVVGRDAHVRLVGACVG